MIADFVNIGKRAFVKCKRGSAINSNILYLVIGALAIVAVVFGYLLYQERQKTTGIEINIGKSGISLEKK
jgi:hypothetical protein